MSFRPIMMSVFGSIGIATMLFVFGATIIFYREGQTVNIEGTTMVLLLAISFMLASVVVKNKEFWEIVK